MRQGFISPQVIIPIYVPHICIFLHEHFVINIVTDNCKIRIHLPPIIHQLRTLCCRYKPCLKAGIFVREVSIILKLYVCRLKLSETEGKNIVMLVWITFKLFVTVHHVGQVALKILKPLQLKSVK
jgi:hypothetical protein